MMPVSSMESTFSFHLSSQEIPIFSSSFCSSFAALGAEHLIVAAFLHGNGSLPGHVDVGPLITGDSGSGFGVVLSEVDALAQSADKALDHFGLVLDHVQAGDDAAGAGLQNFVAVDVLEVHSPDP